MGEDNPKPIARSNGNPESLQKDTKLDDEAKNTFSKKRRIKYIPVTNSSFTHQDCQTLFRDSQHKEFPK